MAPRGSPLRRRAALTVLVVVAASALAGCGLRVPADPDGALHRIQASGTLHAGASPAGAALEVGGDEPRGPLVELVEGFAAEQHATVEWTIGSEEALVEGLERGELDLVAGDMTGATPWQDRVAVTRSYRGVDGADGRPLVLLLPMGENALQSALEGYLDEEVGR